jgi:hypothetical protein
LAIRRETSIVSPCLLRVHIGKKKGFFQLLVILRFLAELLFRENGTDLSWHVSFVLLPLTGLLRPPGLLRSVHTAQILIDIFFEI